MKALPLFFLLIACSTSPAEPPATQLLKQLRTAGVRVEPVDTIQQPFFTPIAHVYRIEGDDLQVYEYADAATASREAARVSSNGSIGGAMPMWIAPPHFYHRDRLIAIYLGTNPRVMNALVSALGAQFAGQ